VKEVHGYNAEFGLRVFNDDVVTPRVSARKPAVAKPVVEGTV